MPIQFSCECGKQFNVPDDRAGKLVECPACEAMVRAPKSGSSASEDEEPQYIGPPEGQPDFFHDPPKEIGAITVGHTSLATHVQPTPFLTRLAMPSVISGFIIGLLIVGAFLGQNYAPHPFPIWVLALGLPGLSLLVLFLVFSMAFDSTAFGHYCGYVGAQGFARYACSGERDHISTEAVMLFTDATELRVEVTRHFMDGRFSHTNFAYRWSNGDEEVFTIGGSHNSEDDVPPPGNSYYFAQDAERVWSIYLLGEILTKLKEGGQHKFPLSGGNYIVLRQDSMKLRLNGRDQEFTPDDIAGVRIENGMITIKEPGAQRGWFTDSGFHNFGFAELANARVFLLLINSLFDVRIH